MRRFGIGAVRVAREPSLLRTTVLRGPDLAKWPLACVKRHYAERFRRLIDGQGIAHPEAFYGAAHAGSVDLALLRLFLASGRNRRLIEIALHPGAAAPASLPEQEVDGWHDPLAVRRPDELQLLLSPELPALLESSGWRLGRLNAAA
jgi:hypothetical protein